MTATEIHDKIRLARPTRVTLSGIFDILEALNDRISQLELDTRTAWERATE